MTVLERPAPPTGAATEVCDGRIGKIVWATCATGG